MMADSDQLTVRLAGGKRGEADYKGFSFKTDQPVSSGGEGTAPSPFDLFLASIGTCAGFYVTAFCLQRQIPTEGIRLVQTMHRNVESHMVERVDIEIHLPPGFPAKYRDAVVRAAESCAVKKHLARPPAFSVVAAKME